jgi:DMSO/TMAO reductase YedYZ molybdopterin-dependent catalytic subunit
MALMNQQDKRSISWGTLSSYAATAAVAGVGVAAFFEIRRQAQRMVALEKLMPPPQVHSTARQVAKPIPSELFVDRGSGTDFETRMVSLDDYLVPTDRFYVRSHSPTPMIDAAGWTLTIEGSGVRSPVSFTYAELEAMPQVTVNRVIECAGNGRHFFKEEFGVEAEGGQWRTGAIGAAEWTGVRLRDLLDRVDLTPKARDVMPEGLDKNRVRWPMPLGKALKDDTILALKMNGEPLQPDHGFPVRMVVSGWLGTASIKWIGRIEVSEEEVRTPWNTTEYILVGPHYPMGELALGPVITEMPVTSMIDLDWPAEIERGMTTIRGRAYAGEGKVTSVAYQIDDGKWQEAEILPPNEAGCWVRWQFRWDARPGEHGIRLRATDDQGRSQPDSVPWNHHGYLYNAVVSHPVQVVERQQAILGQEG